MAVLTARSEGEVPVERWGLTARREGEAPAEPLRPEGSAGASPSRGSRSHRALAAVGLVGVVLALPGCADKRPPLPTRQPTRGTLTYNGKPPVGAIVTFWRLPLEGYDWRTVKPQASVEADGSFQPNSYNLKDGAVVGEYALTVIWMGPPNVNGPDLFKGRFGDPAQPVLKVTIKDGDNELPPIHLTGPSVNAAAAKNLDGT